MKSSWFLGALVAIIFLIIGLYPQINLWNAQRGANEYAGIYAYNDLDETAYAAYLQALIDNRPRRNNPFTGVDDAPMRPLPESLFSIQFLSPSIVAYFARTIGIDASTAFILIAPLAAFAAALVIFWLFLSLTNKAVFAATATLIVLGGGALIIGEGAIIEMCCGEPAYPYFPFLRRYIPAVPFPFFWLFCGTVWQTTINADLSRRILFCIAASICFAFLVYSYFYLWTAALAWLICTAIVWLIFRPVNWQKDLQAFGVLLILAALSLIPYALMLANRDQTMDAVQLLIQTHKPDLWRLPELWSLLGLILLCFGIWSRWFAVQNKKILFAMSLALVSFAVFNQQIITGRSLQPIHYQVFIVNYVSLFAVVLTLFLLWSSRRKRTVSSRRFHFLMLAIALITIVWSAVEVRYTTAVISEANIMRDQAELASQRLRELVERDFSASKRRRVAVLSINLLLGDDLPASTGQSVLWARHQHVFAGESRLENKRRFYHFLYFSGVSEHNLGQQLRENNVITVITLFGWDKLTSRLSLDAKPLTEQEIRNEMRRYAEFCANFNAQEAASLQFSYVVSNNDIPLDFTNIDRWYVRDESEKIGNFILHRVRLQEQSINK